MKGDARSKARREKRRTPAGLPARRPVRRLVPALVALCVLGGAAIVAFRLARPHERPNVVLITIDTLRADHVGAYGDRDAATPVLDELAARGVRFVHAVAHVPLTLPSHASLLTGLTPLAHGVRNNSGSLLGPTIPTLAEQFRAAGYRTAAFVSGFPLHRRFGLARGFDVYDDRFLRSDDPTRAPYDERRADRTLAAAIAWVRQSQEQGTRPFLVWIHFFDPHAPYEPPEPYRTRFSDRPYDGEIAFVDEQIGRLLDSGLLGRNTIVAVTSDHGEGLGEHGEPTHGVFIYESTIRVPLVFAGPGIPARADAASLARIIDIAPTLLDLAGLPPFKSTEGRSLRRAIEGRTAASDEPAYMESLYARLSFGWAPLHGVRDRMWTYVDAPTPELFDLTSDPGEQHNLARERPADSARLARMVRAAVSKAPTAAQASTPADVAERLRSLGYLTGGAIARPSLRDPKELAATAVRIESAIAIERADPARAIAEFQAALRDDAGNMLVRQQLAVALTAAGRFDEAVAELRQLMTSGDDSEETLVLLGDTLRLAGKADQAIRVLEQAAARDPHIPDVPVSLGKVFASIGRNDEAKTAFERALALSSDDPRALAGLADLAVVRGDLNEARERLETLRARDPDDAEAMVKLGVVLVRAGQVESAIPLFRQAIERRPDDTQALVALAGALAKAGRASEAVPLFERAVAAGATTTAVLNSLGFARLESGDEKGAAEALRRSLRANPDQPGVAAALRQLQGRGR